MPGGSPAGTVLGMILYIIYINPINFTSKIQLVQPFTTKLASRVPISSLHLKYCDDVNLLEAINLHKSLEQDSRPHERPLNFHLRTGHRAIKEKIKSINKIEDIKLFASKQKMSINSKKTKVMLFNKCQKIDFMPELQIKDDQNLEVVEEFKIFVLIVSTDLKWNKHV